MFAIIRLSLVILLIDIGITNAQYYDNLPDTLFELTNDQAAPEMTTTVLLYDIDGNGFLDLVTGNYRYPYSWYNMPNSEMGFKTKIHWNYSTGYSTSEDVNNSNINVDCIALGDYNFNSNPDILPGKVTMMSHPLADKLPPPPSSRCQIFHSTPFTVLSVFASIY